MKSVKSPINQHPNVLGKGIMGKVDIVVVISIGCRLVPTDQKITKVIPLVLSSHTIRKQPYGSPIPCRPSTTINTSPTLIPLFLFSLHFRLPPQLFKKRGIEKIELFDSRSDIRSRNKLGSIFEVLVGIGKSQHGIMKEKSCDKFV